MPTPLFTQRKKPPRISSVRARKIEKTNLSVTYMKKDSIFILRERLSFRDSVKARKKEKTSSNNLHEKRINI